MPVLGATGFARAGEERLVQWLGKRCESNDTFAAGSHARTCELPGKFQLYNGFTLPKSARNVPVLGATGFASAVEEQVVLWLGKRCESNDTVAAEWHSRTSELSGNH